MKRVALVTGGNRGIGFEICRQLAKKGYHVILTARDEKKGGEAAESLKKEGLSVEFMSLDVTHEKDVQRLARTLSEKFGRLDVLVNNAGILLDTRDDENASAFSANLDAIRKTFETNTLAPFVLCREMIPLMKKGGYGRVVNLSSGMGQLSEMNGMYPAYRISKTAVNAVTRIFADETQGENILVNSCCPGWVKTEMGGEGAELSIPEGADTPVWLATLPDEGVTGGFFRERKPIAW